MSFVKVFYADISKYFEEDALLSRRADVSAERQARIDRAKRPETKALLLGAGLIIPTALEKVFGKNDFEIKVSDMGKPYVSNADGVFFNVSHTGKYVICAVSDTEVGADLEEIAEAETVMPIADRFFTPLERDAISLSPSPAEAFCRLWTLRESYVKMTGKGFDRGLAPLAMVFPGGTPKIKVDGKILDDVFFTEIRDVYKCRGAVCTKCKAEYSIEKITL